MLEKEEKVMVNKQFERQESDNKCASFSCISITMKNRSSSSPTFHKWKEPEELNHTHTIMESQNQKPELLKLIYWVFFIIFTPMVVPCESIRILKWKDNVPFKGILEQTQD